jgi:hypothetical protein
MNFIRRLWHRLFRPAPQPAPVKKPWNHEEAKVRDATSPWKKHWTGNGTPSGPTAEFLNRPSPLYDQTGGRRRSPQFE